MTYFTAEPPARPVACGCSTAAVTTKQNVLCLHQQGGEAVDGQREGKVEFLEWVVDLGD